MDFESVLKYLGRSILFSIISNCSDQFTKCAQWSLTVPVAMCFVKYLIAENHRNPPIHPFKLVKFYIGIIISIFAFLFLICHSN